MNKYDYKYALMQAEASRKTDKKHGKQIDNIVDQYETMLKEQGEAIQQLQEAMEKQNMMIEELQAPNYVPQIGYDLHKTSDDEEFEDKKSSIGFKRYK